jgi:hypothetical protein
MRNWMTVRWFFVISCLVFLVYGLATSTRPALNWPSILARQAGSASETPSGWDVLVVEFGSFSDVTRGQSPTPAPKGRLLVADMRITNIQQVLSNVTTNDFELKADDGHVFKPALQTASIERGLILGRVIQPGEIVQSRVVFDVDPPLKAFTLTALQTEHRVRVP